MGRIWILCVSLTLLACLTPTYNGKESKYMSIGEWVTGCWVKNKFIGNKSCWVPLKKKEIDDSGTLVWRLVPKRYFFDTSCQKYAAIIAQNQYSPFYWQFIWGLPPHPVCCIPVFFLFCFVFSLPLMKWSDASDFSKDAHFHSIVYKSSPASFLQAFIMWKPNASDFTSWLTYAKWLMARRRQGSFSWMSEFGTEEWHIFQYKRKSKHFRQCHKRVEVRHPTLDKKKWKENIL